MRHGAHRLVRDLDTGGSPYQSTRLGAPASFATPMLTVHHGTRVRCKPTECGRSQPKSGRKQPKFGGNSHKIAGTNPKLDDTRPNSVNPGHKVDKFGPDLPKFAETRPNVVERSVHLVETSLKLADANHTCSNLAQVWSKLFWSTPINLVEHSQLWPKSARNLSKPIRIGRA